MKRVLSEIWIYPVKSLGGVRVTSAKVLAKGLEQDRRWMLVDAAGVAITQRVYPRMALFKLSRHETGFSVTYDGQRIELPRVLTEGDAIEARVWNDTVTVHEPSRGHSQWFSEILGVKCRLVAFPEIYPRSVDSQYGSPADQVSLADAYPLLLIGQSSLDDLNRRLPSPIPMNRFRPNIVFTGGAPYEEDSWKNFRVGTNRFAAVKPCDRCVLTTVDQETATPGIEPLATLATYRKRGSKVLFGQNVIPLDTNEIAEGNDVIPAGDNGPE